MRKLILSLLLFLPLAVMSQVKFQNMSFEEAMKLAEANKKIILVDVMRPGNVAKEKAMVENEIMARKDVVDFFNKNVICIRMDMSTEAGKEFAPRLQMNMYPTFGYYHASGDLIKVKSPFSFAKDPDSFLKFTKECYALDVERRANSRQIIFEEITFEQALAKAKEQNKLVFIDAYTDNCQPCMMMAKNVFTLDRVADKYNPNFINIKLNLGTVETALAKKYGTTGYPSYLFINADGELVVLESGYTNAEKFIAYADKALEKFNGIVFEHGTWAEVQAKSKTTGKPIFVDCYTVWCGPCKTMANKVFKEPAVAEYFNATFINYKVDMEKGEGLQLKKDFEVKAYPTFVFVAPNGEILNRIVGSMDGNEFIEKAKVGLSEKGLSKMQARYKGGDRTPEFVVEYIEVLNGAYLKNEESVVVADYFKTLDPTTLKEKNNWELFVNSINDPSAPSFEYVYTNREEFGKLFGKDVVEGKLFMVWMSGAHQFAKKVNNEATFDQKGFDTYVKRMKKAKVERCEEIILTAKMFNAEAMGDYNEYVKLGDKRLKSTKMEPVSDMMLYNWVLMITKSCKDQAIRAHVITWLESAIARIDTEKVAEEPAIPGTTKAINMMTMGRSYQDIFKKQIEELKK